MPNSKISSLPASTTPLAGTEVLPVVQSGATRQVSVANLTVGRDTQTGPLTVLKNQSGTTTSLTVQNGNAGANSDVSHIFSTANGNWTVNVGRSTGLMTWTSANAIEVFRIANAGDITLSAGNLIQGAAAKGVNFTANTPAAGMTSQLLNWYEEGTWAPNQGSGLTVVGAFSSSGTYTRIGRQVFIRGSVSGATSVAVASAGAISTNLPYSAAADATGAAINAANSASSILRVSSATLTAATAIAATATMTFSAVYAV